MGNCIILPSFFLKAVKLIYERLWEPQQPIHWRCLNLLLLLSQEFPPYNGFGSLEDSLQNCLSLVPQLPRKDLMKMLENSHKVLRYVAKLVGHICVYDVVHVVFWIYTSVQLQMVYSRPLFYFSWTLQLLLWNTHIQDSHNPEDEGRQFILSYFLATNMISIFEKPTRNSGIIAGKFLEKTRVPKPGFEADKPQFYSPADFAIGATVLGKGHHQQQSPSSSLYGHHRFHNLIPLRKEVVLHYMQMQYLLN